MNIMTDRYFELMCNPEKFPFGIGCFNETRQVKLTYFQLSMIVSQFSKDIDYFFTAKYIVESKQIFDDASHSIWRLSQLTARQAKIDETMPVNIRQDRAYDVRGSPPYYQKTFYQLLAMIRQFCTCH